MNFIVSKLKEGSTWSGIAAIIAGTAFIPHADEISKVVPAFGVVVAGVLSIIYP
jgi:NCAIR mutase (PurE)-related protein